MFSKDEMDLGRTHLIEHYNDTGDASPVAQPPHHVPLAFADAEKQSIKKMLDRGLV